MKKVIKKIATYFVVAGFLCLLVWGEKENAYADTLTFPDGIKTITQSDVMHAYQGCNENITEVIIPEGVTTIESWAFYGCSNLTEVKFPATLTTIEDCAFAECRAITQLNLPEGLTVIGERAFEFCDGITSITIPGTVSAIESCAFQYCKNLENVKLQKGLKRIDSYAFSGCEKIKSITIPKGVETIDYAAFAECKKLQKVKLSKGLKVIENDAFYNCDLKTIEIPDGKTELGQGIFTNNRNLTRITFGEGVKLSSDELWEHGTVNCKIKTVYKGKVTDPNLKKYSEAQIKYNLLQMCDPEYLGKLATDRKKKYTKDEIKKLKQATKNATKGCTTDYEKMKGITEYVAKNIYYDYPCYWKIAENPCRYENAADLLKYKRGVCANFSWLVQAMLDYAGIPNQCLYGSDHQFNAAYDSQEKRWILLDVTWCCENSYLGKDKWEKKDLKLDWFDVDFLTALRGSHENINFSGIKYKNGYYTLKLKKPGNCLDFSNWVLEHDKGKKTKGKIYNISVK